MKQCSKCRKELPEADFYKHAGLADGLQEWCITCLKAYSRTPKQLASIAWGSIQKRAGNPRGNLPTYQNVECRMTRDEFMAWAVPAFDDAIEKYGIDASLSVDRIDDTHYELGKIQIIPRGENASKRPFNVNNFAPDGMSWCARCKDYRPQTIFARSPNSSNPFGLECYCKPCNNQRYAEKMARQGKQVRQPKLNLDKAREIRALRGQKKTGDIAIQYGVSQHTIKAIWYNLLYQESQL